MCYTLSPTTVVHVPSPQPTEGMAKARRFSLPSLPVLYGIQREDKKKDTF